ncbi:MAG: hypothetical protein AAFN78_17145 [Pseudomonadota bacterium]
MKKPRYRHRNPSALLLIGGAALCAACSPMRQQVDANPGGYIVSSYSHRGATDGDGSQVFAMSTNPVPGGIESGTVYLESENGSDYAISNTYAHPSYRESSFANMNTGGWSTYSAQHGRLFLNAPGSLNNHLIVLTPPPRPPASRNPGSAGMPSAASSSRMPRSSMSRPSPRAQASRAMAPPRAPTSSHSSGQHGRIYKR